ncbi:MAG: DUF3788 domain-containing protein [Oscillospiraceae bacterium]|nr:DUF3788 domain-containing protein [Oscillospiraceae bacterium]
MPRLEAVSEEELQRVMQPHVYVLWNELIGRIESLYDMEKVWGSGGKTGKYVLRLRRGGKTLVSLFPKEASVGLLLVYGKAERDRFEAEGAAFSDDVTSEYGKAHTYHDGKWIMYSLPNENVMCDLPALLAIKRRPNRIQ